MNTSFVKHVYSPLLIILVFTIVSCSEKSNKCIPNIPKSYEISPSGIDDTAVIQNAINDAIINNRPEVVLSQGTFIIDNQSTRIPEACLIVSGAKNLTIRGQGTDLTHLVINNPQKGLLNVSQSESVSIRSFSLDYSQLPFTQGKVVQIGDNKSFYLRIDDGYQDLDQQISQNKHHYSDCNIKPCGIFFDAEGNIKYNQMFENLKVKKENGNYLIVTDVSFPLDGENALKVDDRFAIPVNNSYTFTFDECSNITLSHVTVYAGSGLGTFWEEISGTIIIDDLQIRRKPGTNRLMSTVADAIHMHRNPANLLIKNCYIEGMGDDAINIYSTGFIITNVSCDKKELQLKIPNDVSGFGEFKALHGFAPGQTLQVLDTNTKNQRGTAIIKSMQVTEYYNPDNKTLEYSIASILIDKPIEGISKDDTVFNYDFASQNAVIVNNIFLNLRGGFRIRSRGAIFIDNIINIVGNYFIYLADFNNSWTEGPSLQESEIYKNDAALYLHPIVFDPIFYLNSNPELAYAFGTTNYDAAKTHWLNHGISEGRQGSPDFSTVSYVNRYTDLHPAYGNNYYGAIVHWLKFGRFEGRIGSSDQVINNYPCYFDFDALYYLNRYPDLKAYYGNDYNGAYNHWIQNGISEGRRASQWFDPVFYLSNNMDLANGIGPTNYAAARTHWLNHGINEGRQGSPDFSTVSYVNRYPDLHSAYGNNLMAGLTHWIKYGRYEGRDGSPGPDQLVFNNYPCSYDFDALYYLNRYPDLKAYYGNDYNGAYNHWIQNGISEGRRASQWFDPVFYLSNNMVLADEIGPTNYAAARTHWLNHGINEGRQGSPDFSTVSYVNRYPDLHSAYGNNLMAGLTHWIKYGRYEGRDGSPE